jgi:hypothetical protein
VPASHGQWGGYRTSKAIGWVICVAPGKWLARYGDLVCGPEPLSRAKANVLALASGADGDYRIMNPVTHLNGLQALLQDQVRDSDNAAAALIEVSRKKKTEEGGSP